MQHMLHAGANMVVAWCEEHLGLMLQSPERRAVDNSGGIPVEFAAHIGCPAM